MADAKSVDGIAPAAPTPAATTPAKKVKKPVNDMVKAKGKLLTVGGLFYGVYVLWCLTLIMLLPDATGSLQSLVLIGVLTTIVGALAFFAVGLLALMRISRPEVPLGMRRQGLIRALIIAVPGVLISLVVPFLITREPALALNITQPTQAADFIAPVAITFSAEEAVGIMRKVGMNPIQYRWDVNGDGKMDQETVVPTLVTNYEKDGVYTVQVRIISSDGQSRMAAKRFIISRAVFSVTPSPPILERPVTFSIANVVPDRTQLQQVQWDFDGDGTVDVTNKELATSYTYYAKGDVMVTVTIQMTNKTQATYSRTITIQDPPPLPFPIAIVSSPKRLISNPPFGVEFTVDTQEPLVDVEWNFGEGEVAHGTKVTHTYERKGKFTVVARARSASGAIAELSLPVSVVDELPLPDLTFTGSHSVASGKISGEVPLILSLTPKTGVPFVSFSWEAPDATEVGSTETSLQAIYRTPGTYRVTLIAQDRQDRVKRIPLTLDVQPPSTSLVIRMDPEGGVAPLRVRFDASESFVPDETISGFIWNFGDRTDPFFGAAQVEHTYAEPGTYNIQLQVRTVEQKEYRTSRSIVVRAPLLRACIEPSRLSGKAPLGVHFSSGCSVGDIASVLWDFGDGSQGDQQETDHVFEAAGTYTVTLTITDVAGRSTSQSVTITVNPT